MPMISTTHFSGETALPADKIPPAAYSPAASPNEEPRGFQYPYTGDTTENYAADPPAAALYDGTTGISGFETSKTADDEKKHTPLLPAALWGMAAAGITLGCKYQSDLVGAAFLHSAQQAADSLSKSGVLGGISVQAAFLQAAVAIILMLMLWCCGLCAVGQPGVFALVLIRGIGVGCTAASVLDAGQLPGKEQLFALLPQALTLTMMVYGACCAVRMGNSVFAQLTAGKREDRREMSALGYTVRMILAAIGIALIWTFVWMRESGKM